MEIIQEDGSFTVPNPRESTVVGRLKTAEGENWEDSIIPAGKGRVSDSLRKHASVPIVNLDDLEWLDNLGEGAYGTVDKYNMVQEDGSRIEVAVKKLKATVEITELDDHLNPVTQKIKCTDNEVEEFTREVRLQAKLDHPNIVPVLGMGAYFCDDFDGDLPFVALEMMGDSLLDHLSRKYSFKTGLQWCLEIALALNYLHDCTPKIIHRDLKPENVMISQSGVAKVADLGLFAAMENKEKNFNAVSRKSLLNYNNANSAPQLTGSPSGRASMMSEAQRRAALSRLSFLDRKAINEKLEQKALTGRTGTMKYMAPENYRGEEYTEKVDQFAFAMVAYGVLDHKEAYHDVVSYTPEQIAASAAKEGGMRPPLRKSWPQPVKTLLQACWEHDPDKRPSFRKVVKDLQEILSDDQIIDVPSRDEVPGCRCTIC